MDNARLQRGYSKAALLCRTSVDSLNARSQFRPGGAYSGTTAIASISIIRSAFASFEISTRVLAGAFLP